MLILDTFFFFLQIIHTVHVCLTDLKDLGKVCVSVGEHSMDAVDGILGLARGASLSFGL